MFKTMPKQDQQSPEKKRLIEQTRGSDQYTAMRQMASLMGNQAMLGMMQSQGQYQKEQTPFFDDMRKDTTHPKKSIEQLKPTERSSGSAFLLDYARKKIGKAAGAPKDVDLSKDKSRQAKHSTSTDMEKKEHDDINVLMPDKALHQGINLSTDSKLIERKRTPQFDADVSKMKKDKGKSSSIQVVMMSEPQSQLKQHDQLITMYEMYEDIHGTDIKRWATLHKGRGSYIPILADYLTENLEIEDSLFFKPHDMRPSSPIESPLDLYYWIAQKPPDQRQEKLNYADPLFLATVLLQINRKYYKEPRREIYNIIRYMQPLYDALSNKGAMPKKELISYYRGWRAEEDPTSGIIKKYCPPAGRTMDIGQYRNKTQGSSCLVFLGYHYTNVENALTILKSKRPNKSMMNTGHGDGKGRGFYYVPVRKIRPKFNEKEAYESPKKSVWGEVAIAVFMPIKHVRIINKATAKQDHKLDVLFCGNEGAAPIARYGDDEAVIPEELFDEVILEIYDDGIYRKPQKGNTPK